jgi:putative methyltransferase
MKNFYLFVRDSYGTNEVSIPILWCSLKTYFEENSHNTEEWQWHDPFLSRLSDDEIFEKFKNNPPDVVGFSVFVWNEDYMDKMSLSIKKKYPNCLIVYGGPQPNTKNNRNYFKEKDWVDLVIPSDAYGEIILQEILENFSIFDYEKIPYIYYPDNNREVIFSKGTINKRQFKWPNNIFKSQENHILPVLKKFKEKNAVIVSLYETSRGCPYKCIYCEWGGGTHTKTIKKPFGIIIDELEWLMSNNCSDRLELTDANFGIVPIDVDISKQISILKRKYNYPKEVDFSKAKNNLDRVLEIVEIFLDANIFEQYVVPVQTLDATTKENIERLDVSFESQVAGINRIKNHENSKNLRIYFELIIGLPGDSYQVSSRLLDTLYQYDQPFNLMTGAWMLLPETPAYSTDMREKFKIKTIKKTYDFLPKIKNSFEGSDFVPSNTMIPWINKSIETVISTYSYSSKDWIKMTRLIHLSIAIESIGFKKYFIDYLVKTHSLKTSEILMTIIDYMYEEKFFNNDLNSLIDIEKNQIEDWLYRDRANSGIDIGKDFPFLIPHYAFYLLIILTNCESYFDEICNFFSKKFNDDKIKDIGKVVSQKILESNKKAPSTENLHEFFYWMLNLYNQQKNFIEL